MYRSLVYPLTLCVALVAIIAPLWCGLKAQDLAVVKIASTYKKEIRQDSLLRMVEVKATIPTLIYELKYATKNNFTGEQLYDQNSKTFLRKPVADALEGVQKELQSKRLSLKIFDAYRPYSVTKRMWDLIKDERYVANPIKGSGHNRGLAVDLTIIDLKTGEELYMGTAFDNFSDTAHHSFTQLDQQILINRKLLKETMMKHGFNPLETEWWHYSWPNDRNYDVLDLSFKELAKLQQL